MANLRASESNSTVRSSWVNSAASCRRIAAETGLKNHIFLHFLWILATGAPCTRPKKRDFFVILVPFHSTAFLIGNLSFRLQNPSPELHLSEPKFLFFWLFCAPETVNLLLDWGKKRLLQKNCSPAVFKRPCFWSKLREILQIRWLQNANFFDVRVNVAANVSVNVSEIGEKSACPVILLP